MSFRVLRPFSLALVGVTALAAAACLPQSTATPLPGVVSPGPVGGQTGGIAFVPAPAPAPAPPSGPANRRIALIGDSITFMAYNQLDSGFRLAGYTPTVSARPGDMFRDRQPAATQIATTFPGTVIVNLGTNDAMCGLFNAFGATPCRFNPFTLEDELRDADAMRGLFAPGSVCFVGVAPSFDAEIGRHWNNLLRAGRINGVIDWKSETIAHPEYLADSIGHLSVAGQTAYARFLLTEQRRICGVLPA